MRITLNGEVHEVARGLTVDALLKSFDLDPRKVAVERNLEIIRRSEYGRLFIVEGDRLEIVHIIGGG